MAEPPKKEELEGIFKQLGSVFTGLSGKPNPPAPPPPQAVPPPAAPAQAVPPPPPAPAAPPMAAAAQSAPLPAAPQPVAAPPVVAETPKPAPEPAPAAEAPAPVQEESAASVSSFPAGYETPDLTPSDQIRNLAVISLPSLGKELKIFLDFLDKVALKASRKPIFLRKVLLEEITGAVDAKAMLEKIHASKAVAAVALVDEDAEPSLIELYQTLKGAGILFTIVHPPDIEKRSIAINMVVDMLLLEPERTGPPKEGRGSGGFSEDGVSDDRVF